MGRPILLQRARELADRLMPAFDTPTGIPDNYINLLTGHHNAPTWNGGLAILAEFGSIQLEFRRLSQQTGDPKYDHAISLCMERIHSACSGEQFCQQYFSSTTGRANGGFAGLGGFGDSYYEYLLKQVLQLNGNSENQTEMYNEMWQRNLQTIVRNTVVKGRYTIAGVTAPSHSDSIEMEHLACFAGGLFALSYYHTQDKEHLRLAEDIAFTCHAMYQSSLTKIAPDSAVFNVNSIRAKESKYILRPETAETYFYLWRVTKKAEYRDWGHEILKAINKYLRVPTGGYSGTHDVNVVEHVEGFWNDRMDSFWMAETLKYLYLLASDDSVLDLDNYVFNTEAHPLKKLRKP